MRRPPISFSAGHFWKMLVHRWGFLIFGLEKMVERGVAETSLVATMFGR